MRLFICVFLFLGRVLAKPERGYEERRMSKDMKQRKVEMKNNRDG